MQRSIKMILVNPIPNNLVIGTIVFIVLFSALAIFLIKKNEGE
ncbi:hypothetical protein CAHE111092_00550 [Campylobacter hepaticus]